MQEILGIAIGIATVCLLLSIIASHLQEVISAYGARRAATPSRPSGGPAR